METKLTTYELYYMFMVKSLSMGYDYKKFPTNVCAAILYGLIYSRYEIKIITNDYLIYDGNTYQSFLFNELQKLSEEILNKHIKYIVNNPLLIFLVQEPILEFIIDNTTILVNEINVLNELVIVKDHQYANCMKVSDEEIKICFNLSNINLPPKEKILELMQ